MTVGSPLFALSTPRSVSASRFLSASGTNANSASFYPRESSPKCHKKVVLPLFSCESYKAFATRLRPAFQRFSFVGDIAAAIKTLRQIGKILVNERAVRPDSTRRFMIF
jgi:hypothetical protein